jgi:hypothetical protein
MIIPRRRNNLLLSLGIGHLVVGIVSFLAEFDVPSSKRDEKLMQILSVPSRRSFHKIGSLSSKPLIFKSLGTNGVLPPSLKHNLDSVLFTPGPVFLKDPKTRKWNFPEHLASLDPPTAFVSFE